MNTGRFWKALRDFSTGGVKAKAWSGDGQSVCITVFSFNAVSLDPPLILLNPHNTSKAAAQCLAVDEFATRGRQRRGDHADRTGATGANTSATFGCC